MTPIEIAALVESGLQLVVKIVELVQAASKGDVAAAEALKSLTDHSSNMQKIADEARQYLDEQFDTGTSEET